MQNKTIRESYIRKWTVSHLVNRMRYEYENMSFGAKIMIEVIKKELRTRGLDDDGNKMVAAKKK